MRTDAPGRTPFSLCVIAFNEEATIRACLESAAFADELLVVDSGSTDRTAEIARESGARVIVQAFLGHVEQKNFAVDSAAHDWVLSLDADERLSPELAESVRAALAASPPAFEAYAMNRRTRYLGGWFLRGGWYPDRKVRLFDRRKARWGGENPHDHVQVRGTEGALAGDIQHEGYRDLAHHLKQINSFSSIAAEAKAAKGQRGGAASLVFRPAGKFLKVYLLQGAWREGTRGFVMAVMGAISVFAKHAKLWESGRASKPGSREPDREGRS